MPPLWLLPCRFQSWSNFLDEVDKRQCFLRRMWQLAHTITSQKHDFEEQGSLKDKCFVQCQKKSSASFLLYQVMILPCFSLCSNLHIWTKKYLPFTNQNKSASTVGSTEGDKKQNNQYGLTRISKILLKITHILFSKNETCYLNVILHNIIYNSSLL